MEPFFSLLYPNHKLNLINKDEIQIGDYVIADLQLKNILNRFINNEENENAVRKELSRFCNDKDVIIYRQKILGDFLKNNDIVNYFIKIKQSISTLFEIYNSQMFIDDLQMTAFKTFLICENFINLYKDMFNGIDFIDTTGLSEEMKEILSFVKDTAKAAEIKSIDEEVQKIRKKLDEISEIRVNRFFSRGQNIENSITTENSGQSITAVLENLSERLGIDKPINNERYRINNLREPMKKLLFRAYSTAYKDIFDEITMFHNKYKDFFNIKWFELIHEVNAVIGFKLIFDKLNNKGLPITPVKISDNNGAYIHNLYSLFLINADTDKDRIVFNDFFYSKAQPFNLLTGPNGGGKTIFLTAVGLCYMFFQSTGYIMAQEAQMTPLNGIYTHFPIEETNEAGRLKEEIKRSEKITSEIKENCIVLLNETYSGTKSEIALELSIALLEKLSEKNTVGIFVTHFHELKDYVLKSDEGNIGILTALVDESIGKRLYKVVSLSTQKGSFSGDILFKYRMTRAQLFERIRNINNK